MKNKNQDQYSVQEEQPSNWFEPLYASSDTNGEGVPWANMDTHPSFGRWLTKNPVEGDGKSALVVGCGMGDDTQPAVLFWTTALTTDSTHPTS